jgi:hypothetical protein
MHMHCLRLRSGRMRARARDPMDRSQTQMDRWDSVAVADRDRVLCVGDGACMRVSGETRGCARICIA